MDTRTSINIDPTGLNSNSSSTEIYDAVVVGAGPIGLATAIGLCQRGIENILVIDQTRAFRSVGQVIDLLPNGLKALKTLDFTAYEAVKEAAIKLSNPPQTNREEVSQTTQPQKPAKSRQWVQRNLQGQPIQSISLEYDDWVKEYGEGRLSISWYGLQTALRNQLPEDRVRTNHRCVNVVDEPETGCVRVDCVFDLGTEANPYVHWMDVPKQENGSQIRSRHGVETSIRARIVVAADGINSRIRSILYRDRPDRAFAQPEYSGFTAVGCFGIKDVPTDLLTELQEKFLQNSPVATIVSDRLGEEPPDGEDPRMILVRRPDGSLGYLLHLALPLLEAKEASGSALIELAVQQLEQANFPESLKHVVQLSASTHLLSRPYYIHRVTASDIRFPSTARLHPEGKASAIQPPWQVGRVVLAGDAAHGMPPLMAQGVNQGLEDALVIATLISRISDQQDWNDSQAINRAFEVYERLRRPMIARVQKATIERFDSSEAARQDYEQQVYRRNIDQELEALLK